MSLVRSSCVLAFALMVFAFQVSLADKVDSENERVKRQGRQVTVGTRITDTTTREATLTLNGINILVLNNPNLVEMEIDVDTSVRYTTSSVIIMNVTSMETFQVINPITRFTFVDTNLLITQVEQPGTVSAETGPGTLYWESTNALFSQAGGVNSLIQTVRDATLPLLIPPSPVEILIVQRTTPTDSIVLNVDAKTDPPDGMDTLTDDIIELTGSTLFMISDRQTLRHAGNTLAIFTRSEVNQVFTVANFYALEPTTQDGISGLMFRQFNSSTGVSPAIIGPGQLRIGLQGGQTVAFYSTIGTVNQDISSALVSMQLSFQATNVTAEIFAAFPPALANQRLISFNGAQVFNFPTATTIEKSGMEISVSSGSILLQRFSTSTPTTLSSFINHQVESEPGDVTYNLPDGGATLWFNIDNNEAFLYPSRNRIIGSEINQAIQTANIMQPIEFATYSISSDAFGFGTLSAKVGDAPAIEVVNVAPARVFDVLSGESVSYTGGMLNIINSDGVVVEMLGGISPFTVNAAGAQYLSSSDNFPTTFGGPGRLYVDSRNRAFFTRNSDIQTFISNFVRNIPQPRIDILQDRDDRLVYFQTGGQNLFALNGAVVETTGPNTAGIYFDNQINFVNRFNVPDNAIVTYNMARDTVRVEDPNFPGRFLFETSAELLFQYDDRPTRPDRESNVEPTVMQITLKDSDISFFQNGNIYYSNRGALVSSSDVVNQGIDTILFSTGTNGLDSSLGSISDIANLTVADGRSIITYSGSAPVVLQNGGTLYTSGGEAIYIANRDFNSRVSGTYSQLNPSVNSYNRTTGLITLTTAEGEDIISLEPGVTQVTNVGRTFSFRYGNGMIIFTPEIAQRFGTINELAVWNGLTFRTYTAADGNVTFSGPGLFWVNNDMAFFTSDTITTTRLTQRINNVIRTFRRPDIGTQQRTFNTKLLNNIGSFPQTINLYEGANIDLNCTVLAANPPATIAFTKLFFNETSERIEQIPIVDDDTTDNYDIIRAPESDTAILRITAIDTVENTINSTGRSVYTCVAENIVGSSSLSTTINVRPPRPPAIVSRFIPPLETVRNSSERLISITSGDTLMFNPRRVTIRGSTGGVEVFDDGTIIVRTLHIGCKGEGLPKSIITWYEVSPISGADTEDFSLMRSDRTLALASVRDEVTVSTPREGRSVLSVALNPRSPMCRRYICEATNVAGTALGGVDICPEFYTCEDEFEVGECSATCGLGVARRRYTTCSIERSSLSGPSQIEYEAVPPGLLPLIPPGEFCGRDQDPCPIITYRFEVVFDMGCSVTCGVGSIMRTIACQEVVTVGDVIVNMTEVNDRFCAGQRRPPAVVTCRDNPPCPFWSAGEFGECSATCRGGVRVRDVDCVQHLFNGTTFELIRNEDNTTNITIVDDDLCANGSISRPFDVIACNEHIDCPFRWIVGAWGLCSAQYPNCEQRVISCENYDPKDYFWPGTIVDDSFCESRGLVRPHSLRSCSGGVCGPGRWEIVLVGGCSVTCGKGQQRRNIICVDPDTDLPTFDNFCNPFRRPQEIVTCTPGNCPGVCRYEPNFCSLVKILGCARPELLPSAQQCCVSCPKQAVII